MAPPASSALLFLVVVVAWAPTGGLAATFGFDFHHRYSHTVRQWVESRNWVEGGAGVWEWPEKGSVEYYAALAEQDRLHRGRRLAGADSPLTFADGNATIRISTLGFLHYAVVSLGTPSTSFLVALDTGSDLFWVPCDCKRCAPTSAQNYGLRNINFSIYSPSSSSTSKELPCSNPYCESQSQCLAVGGACPYRVAYVSANTSSSGVLVQDVLHLVTDDSKNKTAEAQIIFGCGDTQTGSFLDSAAPNGLFGLGLEKLSVPSILSKAGLASDSFSMCFGRDGLGRINFGDKGSSDQDETPFNIHGSRRPTYNVTVTEMRVGNTTAAGDFNVLVDSGTSFTSLADPAYTSLTTSVGIQNNRIKRFFFDDSALLLVFCSFLQFTKRIQDERRMVNSNIPFEYCYVPRSNEIVLPTIGLKMKGGSEFPVTDPIIIVSGRREVFYCLAVLKSTDLSIIGQNFMTGLKLVFDRENLTLGWKQFNCSDVEDSNTLPVKPRNPSAPTPTYPTGPSNYNPEATKESRNGTSQIPLSPDSSSFSLRLQPFRQIFLTLFFVSIIIF